MTDLGRDPRWPRMCEIYGEDAYVNAEMGREVKLHSCSCPVPRRLLPYCLNSVPCGKFVINALVIANR